MVVIGFSSIKLSLLAPGTKRVEFQFGDIPDGLMQADQPTSQIASRIDGPRANQVRGVITLLRVDGVCGNILDGCDQSAARPGSPGCRRVLTRVKPAIGRRTGTRSDESRVGKECGRTC